MRITRNITLALTLALLTATAVADWPQWGRTDTKNMSDPDAKNLPGTFNPGELDADEQVDMATTENIKWAVKLGSQSYGNVTVANGRVYVGTNNDFEEDDRFQGDFSLVVCFDEQTGKKLWKLTVPKIGSGKVGDWEYLGICSSPTIDGDRVYVVTNRCEVLCLDANGQANGNDGPFMDEAQYFIGPGKDAVQVKADDADIIWRYSMGDDLGVFPHNVTSEQRADRRQQGVGLHVERCGLVAQEHPQPAGPVVRLSRQEHRRVGRRGRRARQRQHPARRLVEPGARRD